MPPHGGDVYAAARSLGTPVADLLDFSANINPLGYPPCLRQAVFDSFDLIRHYPDPDCRELRQAIADYHGLSASEVLVGNGSTELIYLLARAWRPDRALVVAPAFSEYERALETAGLAVDFFVTSESDGFLLKDPPELGADDLIFLANPGNPGGGLLGPERLRPILETWDRDGAKVVLDEAFVDFREEASMKALVGRLPGLVVLRSFTKFFGMPGLRLGYLLAEAGLIRTLARDSQPWSVNVLAQVAGRVCLDDPDYIARTRAAVDRERKALAGALAGIDGIEVFPGAANYLLAKLTRTGWTAAELRRRMLRQGILIRDASNFRGLGETFFRVAVRSAEENRRLIESLSRCLSQG
ncbi:MAG: threonine-phosphate decarboxylase CobD [Proteobacteria bacterium]|nr:threonine-phosphate decarboxylase CobD [Pseudomonadota bacterium]